MLLRSAIEELDVPTSVVTGATPVYPGAVPAAETAATLASLREDAPVRNGPSTLDETCAGGVRDVLMQSGESDVVLEQADAAGVAGQLLQPLVGESFGESDQVLGSMAAAASGRKKQRTTEQGAPAAAPDQLPSTVPDQLPDVLAHSTHPSMEQQQQHVLVAMLSEAQAEYQAAEYPAAQSAQITDDFHNSWGITLLHMMLAAQQVRGEEPRAAAKMPTNEQEQAALQKLKAFFEQV
jgi:hypothetical protein